MKLSNIQKTMLGLFGAGNNLVREISDLRDDGLIEFNHLSQQWRVTDKGREALSQN